MNISIIKNLKFGLVISSLLFLAGCFNKATNLELKRVILATDANPMYLEFWPLTAKAWQQVTGLRPTLVLVADSSVVVDESLGDVIRFEPIANIPTALQAQAIRLLIPALFPEDGCIISDIDMIPLQKSYFIDSVSEVPDDCFVVYRNLGYNDQDNHYPMCYNAAKGKIFAEIFGVSGVNRTEIMANIRTVIINWAQLKHGWVTDEMCLVCELKKWPNYANKCIKLNHSGGPRVDRGDWQYDLKLLKSGHYIDSHMLRPYSRYKAEIDELIIQLAPE